MNNFLDLHGLDEQEAIPKIIFAIFELEQGQYDSLEIITGNGGVLRRVVEELLEEHDCDWHHENNNYGSYIVTLL